VGSPPAKPFTQLLFKTASPQLALPCFFLPLSSTDLIFANRKDESQVEKEARPSLEA
jgi:hypothetical protein